MRRLQMTIQNDFVVARLLLLVKMSEPDYLALDFLACGTKGAKALQTIAPTMLYKVPSAIS